MKSIKVTSYNMLKQDGSSVEPTILDVSLYNAKTITELKEQLEAELKNEGIVDVKDIDLNSSGGRYNVPAGYGIASVGGYRIEIQGNGRLRDFDLTIVGAYLISEI